MSAAPVLEASSRRYRIAIVGAGPAGFYAAEALLQAPEGIAVDLYDRLPAPYGLVRYGVAPDHPKLKQVINVFRAIAALPGFRFFGNVNVGEDVILDDLRRHYHAVIVACGAGRDRPLDIPGADLAGVYGGLSFVGWYNGHPDQRDLAPDLSGRTAVVLGLGNVALDVARILSKSPDALANTDIAAHALDALVRSNIDRILVAGRGGPAQARCTEKELREFGELPGCVSTAEPGNYQRAPEGGVPARFERFPPDAFAVGRRCHFAFGLRPAALLGDARVRAVRFVRSPVRDGIARLDTNDDGQSVELAADLVIACIGSLATMVPGLPYAAGDSIARNEAGRVSDGRGPIPGLYVAGWIKRGASGTIGTNRADSVETVAGLLADLRSLPDPPRPVEAITGPNTPVGRASISFSQWETIDNREVVLGSEKRKPREKFTCVGSMLATARALTNDQPIDSWGRQ